MVANGTTKADISPLLGTKVARVMDFRIRHQTGAVRIFFENSVEILPLPLSKPLG